MARSLSNVSPAVEADGAVSRLRIRLRRIGLLGVLATCGAILATAQGVSGRIVGTLTDSSGGVIPSAAVTITNQDTGIVTRAVSNSNGEYRADTRSRGVVQVPIGKTSFTREQLLDNFRAVVDELNRAKPAAAKGRYIKSIAVSSTMGPGIKIDTGRLRVTEEELASTG